MDWLIDRQIDRLRSWCFTTQQGCCCSHLTTQIRYTPLLTYAKSAILHFDLRKSVILHFLPTLNPLYYTSDLRKSVILHFWPTLNPLYYTSDLLAHGFTPAKCFVIQHNDLRQRLKFNTIGRNAGSKQDVMFIARLQYCTDICIIAMLVAICEGGFEPPHSVP